jgi:hypothetical protein
MGDVVNGDLKAKLLKQREQLTARIAAIESRDKEKSRKLDTRHKIILGACVLADAEHHPDIRPFVEEILRRTATRDRDRELLRSMGWEL